MRESARQQMGHFPTPDRVAEMIAGVISLGAGKYSILDPCAGDGSACVTLRNSLMARNPQATVVLHGIEADRTRAALADERFRETGGACIKGLIENTHPTSLASILYFNPPYDLIRGDGRLETLLYAQVEKWVVVGGIIVVIIPDHVLVDLSLELERRYEMKGRWLFPLPEYESYGQSVYVGVRNPRSVSAWKVSFPDWARYAESWPVLSRNTSASIPAKPASIRNILRKNLDDADLRAVLNKSPVSRALLAESSRPAPPPEPPLHSLRPGHIALAMAGGLCDGIIDRDGQRFLLRGTHSMRYVKKTCAFNEDKGGRGETTEVYRTEHELLARCLCEDGTIKNFSSNDHLLPEDEA